MDCCPSDPLCMLGVCECLCKSPCEYILSTSDELFKKCVGGGESLSQQEQHLCGKAKQDGACCTDSCFTPCCFVRSVRLWLASGGRAGTTCPVQRAVVPGPNAGSTCCLAAFITPQRGCRLRWAGHMAPIPTSLMSPLFSGAVFWSLCCLLSDHIAALFVLFQCQFPPLSSLWWLVDLFVYFFISHCCTMPFTLFPCPVLSLLLFILHCPSLLVLFSARL